jgi:hypothetical protein
MKLVYLTNIAPQCRSVGGITIVYYDQIWVVHIGNHCALKVATGSTAFPYTLLCLQLYCICTNIVHYHVKKG